MSSFVSTGRMLYSARFSFSEKATLLPSGYCAGILPVIDLEDHYARDTRKRVYSKDGRRGSQMLSDTESDDEKRQNVRKTTMNDTRETIVTLVEAIEPFDELEREHRNDALEWIGSGTEIFRIAKPETPPKHLVSYFVVVDPKNEAILLVDHINAEKWLPTGGHVEVGENPKTTVERESVEELGMQAEFLFEEPVFVSQMTTGGKNAGHRDVSLWYVISGNADTAIHYEEREFNGIRWFPLDEVLKTDIARLDEHLHRFISKLKTLL